MGDFISFADFARQARQIRESVEEGANGPAPLVLLHMTKLGSYQVVHSHLAAALVDARATSTAAYRIEDRARGRAGLRRLLEGLMTPAAAHPLDIVYSDIVDEVVVLRITRRIRREAARAVERYYASRPTRSDLERFSVRGIHLGDLVYDKFIQSGNPVVDPMSPALRRHLMRFSQHAIALDEYCDGHIIDCFVSGASAHEPGVPSRVAAKRARPAFIATQDLAVRLSTHRPIWNLESMDYRVRLARLPEQRRQNLNEMARGFVDELVVEGSGDLTTTGQRPWAVDPEAASVLPPEDGRPQVLVAVHSFYDDPHASGLGLFPDFYAWIEHLTTVMARSDYRWILKLHPDQRDDRIGVRPALDRLLETYDQAMILPDGVSHPQLLAGGIDLALTVYGTIGFEYPAAGVPVLTAGPLNLHRPFAYCLHAETVEEYDRYLLDPASWRYVIPREEILDFVAMHYLHRATFPFHTVPFVERHLEGSGDFFKDAGFPDLWAKEVTRAESDSMMSDLRQWVESGTYDFQAFLADRDHAGQ